MRKIYYGRAVYNNKEIKAVEKVLKNNSLSLIDGPHVKKIEKMVPYGRKKNMKKLSSRKKILQIRMLNKNIQKIKLRKIKE